MKLLPASMATLRQTARKWRTRRIEKALEAIASDGASGEDLAVVFGNCQAAPIAALLQGDQAFSRKFRLVRIPAVQEITTQQADLLRRVLPHIQLLVTQEIRDNYRDLPVGTNQLLELLPKSSQVVRYPVLYYEGLHPYQVYIRHTGPTSELAPLTDYTDLRFLAIAARGLSDEQGRKFLKAYTPPRDALIEIHESSLRNLRDREARLDVAASDFIADSSNIDFYTVNHPSNAVLSRVAGDVSTRVGISSRMGEASHGEFLDHTRAPIDATTLEALHRDAAPDPTWTIGSSRVSNDVVMQAHLAWLRARPTLVKAGLHQHAQRLDDLGLE
ncbi:hypothetical protein J7E29_13560 [Streptomyces sp. ISL-90]|nr:hypothetical protein [Streptomyces sp. ISL-90]